MFSTKYPIKPKLVLLFVASLVAVGQLASTIFLPSMPIIAVYFNVPDSYIQYACSAYILAYACSQLIYGPLSDYYGRRINILISLVLFIIGTVLSCASQFVLTFIIGAFIQGLGMGCSSSMARAIIRDISNNKSIQKYASYLSLVLAAVPLIGPMIGGYVQQAFFWQTNFILLAILGLIALLSVLLFMPETNYQLKGEPIRIKEILKDYSLVVKNKAFIIYTCGGLFGISAEVCYEVSAPFLFQGIFHLTPLQYGCINIIPLIGYAMGSFIAIHCQKKFNLRITMLVGFSILAMGGFIMLAQTYFLANNILGVIIPMFIAMIGLGMVFPCSIAGAILPFSSKAGTAGAAIGGLQNLGASLASVIIASFSNNTFAPLAGSLIACALLASIIIFLFEKTYKKMSSNSTKLGIKG